MRWQPGSLGTVNTEDDAVWQAVYCGVAQRTSVEKWGEVTMDPEAADWLLCCWLKLQFSFSRRHRNNLPWEVD